LKDARAFLYENRNPDDAVVQAAESAVREIVGRNKVDSVLYERQAAMRSLQKLAADASGDDGVNAAKRAVKDAIELYNGGIPRQANIKAEVYAMLDPIGFGLEKFDAIGRWRDRDSNGQPIDAAGELPGAKRFSGPKDLKAIIAGRNGDVARNLVEKLLAYALGRRLEGYDEIVVDDLTHEVAEDGYRMQTLIKGVVTSYPFTHRRIGRKEELQ